MTVVLLGPVEATLQRGFPPGYVVAVPCAALCLVLSLTDSLFRGAKSFGSDPVVWTAPH